MIHQTQHAPLHKARKLITLALGTAIFAIGIPTATLPATANVENPDSIALSAPIETLPAPERAIVTSIVDDPRFGNPGHMDEMLYEYPELSIVTTSGFTPGTPVHRDAANSPADNPVTPAATGNRAWVTNKWTILGVTYASITTEANFNNNGALVTKVNSCWNSHSDYIGARFVAGESYSNISGGILTCSTDWILKRAVGSDQRISQGFKVTGNGTFLSSW